MCSVRDWKCKSFKAWSRSNKVRYQGSRLLLKLLTRQIIPCLIESHEYFYHFNNYHFTNCVENPHQSRVRWSDVGFNDSCCIIARLASNYRRRWQYFVTATPDLGAGKTEKFQIRLWFSTYDSDVQTSFAMKSFFSIILRAFTWLYFHKIWRGNHIQIQNGYPLRCADRRGKST